MSNDHLKDWQREAFDHTSDSRSPDGGQGDVPGWDARVAGPARSSGPAVAGEPVTEAGRADHDWSWADDTETHRKSIGPHHANREGCRACQRIAEIERQAAAPYRNLSLTALDIVAERQAAADTERLLLARLMMIDGIASDLAREFGQGNPFEPFDRHYVLKRVTVVLDAARERAALAGKP